VKRRTQAVLDLVRKHGPDLDVRELPLHMELTWWESLRGQPYPSLFAAYLEVARLSSVDLVEMHGKLELDQEYLEIYSTRWDLQEHELLYQLDLKVSVTGTGWRHRKPPRRRLRDLLPGWAPGVLPAPARS
jgi:hypothetical protein